MKGTVLTGEKFVMSTLRFDLEIEHPYEPALDWAEAGRSAAIYLGSDIVKVKLPCDGKKDWWLEFSVTNVNYLIFVSRRLEFINKTSSG
ncbi:unnamed protein product [Eruca vesicaria subsp. sativa]|uniref:Uncharacterized protein n=1 Tax=Eruca vesicaria subsp. sativa TaxID=29727 RepID=A0ABC8KZB4_ERUVS|nr:unnamed protein product [Eruca vesicaria subsp. sativa]